jgi:hypothetical protein
MRRAVFAATTLVSALAGTVALGAGAAGPEKVDFARDVAPILQQRCFRCHRAENRLGNLSLTTEKDLRSRGLVVPGKPQASTLLAVVKSPAGTRPRMPKEGAPLSEEQVATLERWIAQGAVWPQGFVVKERAAADRNWWSLRRLKPVTPPSPVGLPAAWKSNPIDRFVFDSLGKKGLTPSPGADRRTLIRRVTYDLTGLPPTPDEVQAFLNDKLPGAYERVVDRLLASPAYGEQWGRHWLDVIRFGESRGYERNEIIPNAWPFRDYVIRSFNDDKPYDRLVQEHLAGDALSNGDPNVEVGVTFLTCGPYDDVGNQDAVQAAIIRANTLDDIIRATGESFLGVTVGCARCHDHKFDPVLTKDYYALFATFSGVRHGNREVATQGRREERARLLPPLQKQAADLAERREDLEFGIMARAEKQAATMEGRWVRPPANGARIEERFEPVTASKIRLTVEAASHNPNVATGYQIDEFEAWTAGEGSRNVASVAAGGRAEGAGRVAQDFADAYSARQTIDGILGATWIAEGPTLTLTFAAPAKIDRVVFSSNRDGTFGKPFPADYRLEVSTDGTRWSTVASSADRKPIGTSHRRWRLIQSEIKDEERAQIRALAAQQAEVNAKIAALPQLPVWWVGNFEQPSPDVKVYVGGSPTKPGDPVSPASPSLLQDVEPAYSLPPNAPERDRRLALANWLTSPQNPLTPRVMVNRVWQYHFGTGIVDTPSDLGYMGGRPSHPELLDYLAARFSGSKFQVPGSRVDGGPASKTPASGGNPQSAIRNPQSGIDGFGWRLKPLHRLIVTSMAYRQASTFRADAAKVDQQARYLWRFPPRRLAAEELRDTMLALSGKLDRKMGGPGFRLFQYLQDNVATYVPLDHPGEETYRRAVYHHHSRATFVDVLTDFDCPDNAFGAPKRSTTTTPLQALTLLNHAFTLDMAGYLAQRLEGEVPGGRAGQVRRAFLLAYGRQPSAVEQAECSRLVQARGLRSLCRVLLNSNELIYLD